MTKRRPMGSLEDDVMDFLWMANSPATPGQVHTAVAPELAYTTVMTVLTRLWSKGRLHRERLGRAYYYAPVESEADHRASSMTHVLAEGSDRSAVLSSFVEALDGDDAEVLRRLLKDR